MQGLPYLIENYSGLPTESPLREKEEIVVLFMQLWEDKRHEFANYRGRLHWYQKTDIIVNETDKRKIIRPKDVIQRLHFAHACTVPPKKIWNKVWHPAKGKDKGKDIESIHFMTSTNARFALNDWNDDSGEDRLSEDVLEEDDVSDSEDDRQRRRERDAMELDMTSEEEKEETDQENQGQAMSEYEAYKQRLLNATPEERLTWSRQDEAMYNLLVDVTSDDDDEPMPDPTLSTSRQRKEKGRKGKQRKRKGEKRRKDERILKNWKSSTCGWYTYALRYLCQLQRKDLRDFQKIEDSPWCGPRWWCRRHDLCDSDTCERGGCHRDFKHWCLPDGRWRVWAIHQGAVIKLDPTKATMKKR